MYRSNSGVRVIPVVLLGPGKVGSAFERHVRASSEAWRRKGVQVEIVATVRRDGVRLAGQDPAKPQFVGWRTELPGLFAGMETPPILVDASSGETLETQRAWIDRGWTVVTANKIPLSESGMDVFPLLAAANDPRGCRYWFEATVGAGLPVVSTLRELVTTGDEDIEVRAIPSGTLNYLCSCRQASIKFQDALRLAEKHGLTESDPRIDLGGRDVLRKGRILHYVLAGLSGSEHQLPFLPSETLVGDDATWRANAAEAFEKRVRDAKRSGNALRYILHVSTQGRVKTNVVAHLEEVRPDSPFGSSRNAENVFVITSKRYAQSSPLIIRGPGAGPEVTATALYGDVLAASGLL